MRQWIKSVVVWPSCVQVLSDLHNTFKKGRIARFLGCGVAQKVLRRLAVRQARVRFSGARHPGRFFPLSWPAMRRLMYRNVWMWWIEWMLLENIKKSGITPPNLNKNSTLFSSRMIWAGLRIRIRIRIGSGFNRASGSGSRRAKMTTKVEKNL
jgi:hypothetical protein